eukprot:TRINITY_DN9489_c0_g1_i1.p1 TRINITY_DN9489_c0_g1~~TRINITY_DN9489_c0_g1_i1.p1  ORF type:complete len:138 (+),score=40.02 TRINITY_DN9489_c0_g1_i1:223-636(+)
MACAWFRGLFHGVFAAKNRFELDDNEESEKECRLNELRQEIYDKQMSTLISFESVILAALTFLAGGTCPGVTLLFQIPFCVQAALICLTVGVYILATATHGLGRSAFVMLRAIMLFFFGFEVIILGSTAVSIFYTTC